MQETGNDIIQREERLIVRVGKGSLAFAYKDADNGSKVFLPYGVNGGISMAANLREALKDETMRLLPRWRKVQVLLDSPTIMVPVDEYDDHNKELLFNYSMRGQENNAVLATILPQVSAVALYAMNKDLRLVFADNFADIKIHPVCGSVWQYLQRRSMAGNNEKLYCYFHDGKLDVCSFRKNRFRFANAFQTPHAGDAAYFILAAWEQLAMNAKKDDIYIVGQFREKDELLKELNKFVANVYNIKPSSEFNRHPLALNEDVPFDMLTTLLA